MFAIRFRACKLQKYEFNMCKWVTITICLSTIFYPSFALNESCAENADCKSAEKSVCIDNTCTCDVLWHFLESQQKCVKVATEYGAICFEDQQCTDFLGDMSECNDITSVCTCKENYRWYQGKCQKIASKGETCDTSTVCLDPSNPLSLTCGQSKTCECTDGYYDRGNDCRRISKYDEECAISMDCFPACNTLSLTVYSHCELGVCVLDEVGGLCNDTIYSYHNTSHYEEPKLQTDVSKICSSPLSNLTVEDCSTCPNTLYFQNASCVCNRGFFLLNGVCVAELGVSDPTRSYSNDSDCLIKPGKLVDGVCFCKDYWFQSENNRECKKTTLESTKNCMDNDWCQAMGSYSYCDSETEQCQCSSQAVMNETSFYCELKTDANLTGICLSNSDCALYETCRNEKCECTDGFYRPNETALCLPKIGSTCEARDCTHIENAHCSTDEVCECESSEFVTDDYMCVKAAVNIYDECLIEQQCQNVKHSSCLPDTSGNATNRCLCDSTYRDVEGTCYALKTPGSLCSTQRDCTIILGDSFVCRNMLCQCPLGKSLDSNNVCSSAVVRSWSMSCVLVVVISSISFWFS